MISKPELLISRSSPLREPVAKASSQSTRKLFLPNRAPEPLFPLRHAMLSQENAAFTVSHGNRINQQKNNRDIRSSHTR